MASEHHIVTLRAPPAKLRLIHFNGTKVLNIRKPKKKSGSRGGAGSGAGGNAGGTGSTSGGTGATGGSNGGSNSGSNTGGTVDPILGNLPRSLKAAPAANTAGLVLDKTPCRKWVRRPLVIRTFTGYDMNFVGWCSSYTEAELEARASKAAAAAAATTTDTAAASSTATSASEAAHPDPPKETKGANAGAGAGAGASAGASMRIKLKLGKKPPSPAGEEQLPSSQLSEPYTDGGDVPLRSEPESELPPSEPNSEAF